MRAGTPKDHIDRAVATLRGDDDDAPGVVTGTAGVAAVTGRCPGATAEPLTWVA